MTYTLRFLPEVEEDVISGFSWYETKSPSLGDEFLRMFYACAGDIPRNPLLYSESTQRVPALFDQAIPVCHLLHNKG
jgi:hypothetical protein